MSSNYSTQNALLLKNLMEFYKRDDNLSKMLSIINGESNIIKIVDWFATNFAKHYFNAYDLENQGFIYRNN